MDAKHEKHCTRMARKYHEIKSRKVRNKIRNKLFNELQPFLQSWVRAILTNCNRFEPDEEILSLSWQCFLYALDRYKKGNTIPLPKHFHTYSRFYLLKEQEKEAEERSFILVDETVVNELKNSLTCGFTVDEASRALLRALSELHRHLPEEYKIVFEDELLNPALPNKEKMRRITESGLSTNRYNESRKVFGMVITHMKEIY